MKCTLFFVLLLSALRIPAQSPGTRTMAPDIQYTLAVDTSDLSGFWVRMEITHVPDSFLVAMAVHPEYDDKYWRYLHDLSVHGKNGYGSAQKLDSGLWQIHTNGNLAILQYRIQLPPPGKRLPAAWRPFLTPSGGMAGGIQSFLYLVGHEKLPARVHLIWPEGWSVATGLAPAKGPRDYKASSAFELMDCPILFGRLKTWTFSVQKVPHHIVYWPSAGGVAFDSAVFVSHIEKLVKECYSLFGSFPYKEYYFLFRDSAFGALEHSNSVTIGLPSQDLAKNPSEYLEEIAHEYFHTWNIMHIRPAEFIGLSYRPSVYSKSLWWSEGVTMLYADLLLRRAGLPLSDSSRQLHLQRLIRDYYGDPGNYHFSAEDVSRASYAPNGMLGDYAASTHLQGELLATMLDMIVMDHTDGRKSLDDIWPLMMHQFGPDKGFENGNIETMLESLCQCSLKNFFQAHISGNQPIPFNTYLSLVGLHADTLWQIAKNDQGFAMADNSGYAWQKPGDSLVRIGITDPNGAWGKAGLHTGNMLMSLNGIPLRSMQEFRAIMDKMSPGQQMSLSWSYSGLPIRGSILFGPQWVPVAKVSRLPQLTPKQEKLLAIWDAGKKTHPKTQVSNTHKQTGIRHASF